VKPLILSIALAAVAIPAAASAQAGPSVDPDDDIVVRGTREQEKQAERFVGALTDAPIGGQITQFANPVCPSVRGLGPERDGAIVGRLRQVAAASGMRVAPPQCVPNVVVVVVPDRRAFVTTLRKTHPIMFTEIPRWQVTRMIKAPGPTMAWQVVGMVGLDGMPLSRGDPPSEIPTVSSNGMQSRLHSPARPHFVASFLVVDLAAVAGLSTRQLADYAAMRTFIGADPARAARPGASTILTLLDDAAADRPLPQSLTQWDFSFLKSLYSTSNEAYANLQRSEIAGRFKKDVAAAEKVRE
jgi:hypothetical protein